MLNEKIKELRLLNGFNQVELAKRLGLTKQTISNWENNNIQPSIEMLEALADLFSVSTDYLLGRENNRELDSTGLTNEQINHIQQIINDIQIGRASCRERVSA